MKVIVVVLAVAAVLAFAVALGRAAGHEASTQVPSQSLIDVAP